MGPLGNATGNGYRFTAVKQVVERDRRRRYDSSVGCALAAASPGVFAGDAGSQCGIGRGIGWGPQ